MLNFKNFFESDNHQSVTLILRDSEDYVLILLRSLSVDWAPNTWGLPGGSIEDEEDPEEACIRECFEETKIQPKNVELYKNMNLEETNLYVYTGFSETNKPKINWEHKDYEWISENELNDYEFAPNVKEILTNYFRNKTQKI
jgi:8-oxo-dGTP diphosphatase